MQVWGWGSLRWRQVLHPTCYKLPCSLSHATRRWAVQLHFHSPNAVAVRWSAHDRLPSCPWPTLLDWIRTTVFTLFLHRCSEHYFKISCFVWIIERQGAHSQHITFDSSTGHFTFWTVKGKCEEEPTVFDLVAESSQVHIFQVFFFPSKILTPKAVSRWSISPWAMHASP